MLDVVIDHVSITGDVMIVTFSVYFVEDGFKKLIGQYKFQGVYNDELDLEDIAKIVVEKAKKHYEAMKKAVEIQMELNKKIKEILKL